MRKTMKNFVSYLMTSWKDLEAMSPSEQRSFWKKTAIFSGICGAIGLGINWYVGKWLVRRTAKHIQEDIDAMVKDIESQAKPWGDSLDNDPTEADKLSKLLAKGYSMEEIEAYKNSDDFDEDMEVDLDI